MFDNPEIFITLIVLGGAALALGWKFLRTKWKWLQAQLDKTDIDEITGDLSLF